jgi:NADH-quinone oxidoreductase subunit M
MATLGLPGMSGFISEFLAFLGIFETQPVLGVLGVLGMILAALYMLRAVLGTTFGPAKGRWQSLKDTRPAEAVPMLVLLGFIVLIGVYPAVLNDPLYVTLESIVARMGG